MSWVTRHPQGWVGQTLKLLSTILEYSQNHSLLSLQLLRGRSKFLGSTSLGGAAVLARDRVTRHRRLSIPSLPRDHGPDRAQVKYERR